MLRLHRGPDELDKRLISINMIIIRVLFFVVLAVRGLEYDQTLAKIQFTQSSGRFTYESPDEGLPQDTVHQWYQRYGEDAFVGTIPPVKGNKSKFIMESQKFDLNTSIHCRMNTTSGKKDLNTEVFPILLLRNGYKEYVSSKRETYSELEKIHFSCENKAHTQIGWIEPTGARITTYNTLNHSWTFTKTDNNSHLCCLHYNTYYIKKDEVVVERSIEIISVLIYEEPVIQDNVTMASSSPESNNSQEARPTLVSSSSPKPEAPQDTIPADNPPHHQHTESKTKYYIGIASVAGIIILISLMYVVIKKCYRKSSDHLQTLQLETYASANVVQYAELDIRPGNGPPPASTEYPTYAEIIGVLRPQNENVKK